MNESERKLAAAAGYLELGMVAEAEEEFAGLGPEQRASPPGRALQLEFARQHRRWPEMAALARTLAAEQPREVAWIVNWAYAARRAESVARAHEILLAASEAHGQEAIVPFNLACYCAQLGKLDQARAFLQRAVSLEGAYRRLAREEPDLAPLRALDPNLF